MRGSLPAAYQKGQPSQIAKRTRWSAVNRARTSSTAITLPRSLVPPRGPSVSSARIGTTAYAACPSGTACPTLGPNCARRPEIQPPTLGPSAQTASTAARRDGFSIMSASSLHAATWTRSRQTDPLRSGRQAVVDHGPGVDDLRQVHGHLPGDREHLLRDHGALSVALRRR